eukprot:6189580-Pleurochrysis_carterae.AAC.1
MSWKGRRTTAGAGAMKRMSEGGWQGGKEGGKEGESDGREGARVEERQEWSGCVASPTGLWSEVMVLRQAS